MVVVVSPAPLGVVLPPVFCFADDEAWKASEEWSRCLAERCPGQESLVLEEPPSAQQAEQVRGARSAVVRSGSHRKLAPWRESGLGAALAACHAAGGLVAVIGQVAALLGAWFLDDDKTLERGQDIIQQAVVFLWDDEKQWKVCQNAVAALHGTGHEKIKAYRIYPCGGAAFYLSGEETRAEAIGKTMAEARSIPKTAAIGKVLKMRKIMVPDPSVVAAVGHRCDGRWEAALDLAAQWLLDAKGSSVVSTGAGISAESGIPTYRDPGGLWEIYDQMEVSHIKGFARDPLKCWRFELELHQIMQHCGPNAAHLALRDLEAAGVLKAVVTQNVDGLHVAAGSKEVLELHGSETRGICMKASCRKVVPYIEVFESLGWVDNCGSTTALAPPLPAKKVKHTRGGIYAELTDSSSSSSDESSDSSTASAASRGPVKFKALVEKLSAKTQDPAAKAKLAAGPFCQVCREGVIKPDGVYFGEPLPRQTIKRAISLSSSAKAFLVVGTSGQVAPACKLPALAKTKGAAKVIEVSPRETDMSADADLLLMGTAATVLPALAEAVKRRAQSSS